MKFPRAKLEHLLTEGGAMVLQRLFSAKRLEKFERLVQRAEQRERAFARSRAHAREDAVLESARSETAADGIAAPASAPPAPASTSASASLPAPVPVPVTAAPSSLSRRGLENERSGVITDIDLRFLAFDQDYNLAEFSYVRISRSTNNPMNIPVQEVRGELYVLSSNTSEHINIADRDDCVEIPRRKAANDRGRGERRRPSVRLRANARQSIHAANHCAVLLPDRRVRVALFLLLYCSDNV